MLKTAQTKMLWRYLSALFYDLCILIAIFIVVAMLVVALQHGNAIPVATRWFQVLLVTIAYLYYLGSLCFGAQTIGHKAWGLRLHTPNGCTRIASIHRRILWFWLAFLLLKWAQQQRLRLFTAHGAASLEKI